MNPFDALWEDRPMMKGTMRGTSPSPQNIKRSVDYGNSAELYKEYLTKSIELAKQRQYAEKVVKATHGSGMTPVMPLATMGTNGGPLLCDYCSKPIILEGGKYHGWYADKAWAEHNHTNTVWTSWIKGGLMVRIVDNGTLRIYHGYEGRDGHCDTIATAIHASLESRFKIDMDAVIKMAKYLEMLGESDKLSDVVATMLSFDPGLGVNRA